jgi:hypothetical protein
VFVPSTVMDAAWDGDLELDAAPAPASRMDIRTSDEGRRHAAASRRRFQLATLVQKLAPNLHRWNRSLVFGIDRLRRDIGWEPEYTFRTMVGQTYEWFRREGLDATLQFDFTFEDQLLARVAP